MGKTPALLGICLLLCCALPARVSALHPDYPYPAVENFGTLQGNVKWIYTYWISPESGLADAHPSIIDFDRLGRATCRTYYDTQGNPCSEEAFFYGDETGRLLSYESYLDSSLSVQHRFIYTADGQIASHTVTHLDSVGDIKSIIIAAFEYDDAGRLIRAYNPDSNIAYSRYTYDGAGACIETDWGDTETHRIYNALGQVIEDWTVTQQKEVVYSDPGRKWRKRLKRRRGAGLPHGHAMAVTESPHTFYSYNERGLLSMRSTVKYTTPVFGRSSTEGALPVTDTLSYEYDERGNWIYRRQSNNFFSQSGGYLIPGALSQATEVARHIEYYD